MAKSNGKSVQNRTSKKGAFLEEFARSGNIAHAAKIAGIGRQTHYDWINPEKSKDAEEYRKMFEDAKHDAIAVLELEARRRAAEGVERLKFHQGDLITLRGEDGKDYPYVERQYSDTLLIFLLKANSPEKYRERAEIRHEGNVEVNHTIQVRSIVDAVIQKIGDDEHARERNLDRLSNRYEGNGSGVEPGGNGDDSQ